MTAGALRDRIAELGPWYQPFTLAEWNTWEVAPHPVHTPDPIRAQYRWQRVAAMLPAGLDGWRILDVGCGEGYLATELAHLGADVDAIDIFPPAIERARLVADVLDSGVKARVADVCEIEEQFDLVLMSNVLSLLPDPPLALRHAAALSPRLLVHCALRRPAATEPTSLWTPSRTELEEALRDAGYSTLRPGDPGDPLSAIYLAEEIRAEIF